MHKMILSLAFLGFFSALNAQEQYIAETNATKVKMYNELEAEVEKMKDEAKRFRSSCIADPANDFNVCESRYEQLMLDIHDYHSHEFDYIRYMGEADNSPKYKQVTPQERELEDLLGACLTKNSTKDKECIQFFNNADPVKFKEFIESIPEYKIDYDSIPDEPLAPNQHRKQGF
ncbi:hypothetical protein ACPF04_06250 [Campylobacter sp. MOP51]|uniref:hypothetical protein n=1 Tax=Campylobacter canis TaxID=3378588 RepID=UPI003C5017BA